MGQTDSGNALDEHERLVARLLDPARFPHPVREVRLIETHISSVLLTGDYAYKLKKPLDLGFLDFSTLAKRRACCAEEVRLNRRLAPAIYLGVVPIVGSLDDPHVDGAGAAIDYAVKMREFPQSALLAAMLAAGRLATEHIDAVARVVAAFHRRIDCAPAAAHYGSGSNVALPVLQNFEQIGQYSATPAERQALAALRTWTEASLNRLEAVLEQRRRNSFVRECHGDLHLGNIAWIDGEVRAFDGIEFNANLRWIDVISEAAFLFMDLSERGRPDFAWRFLNGYLDGTGDYGGMGLLDFYLVYRAMVRAKVGRMRAAQAHLSAAERAAAMASFAAYLRFAQRCSQPRRPLLIISHGLSASGKSSVTQALLEKLGAVRVRSDVERKRLHGLPADARTQSATMGGIYGADTTERTYRTLFGRRSIDRCGGTYRHRRCEFSRSPVARSGAPTCRRVAGSVPHRALPCERGGTAAASDSAGAGRGRSVGSECRSPGAPDRDRAAVGDGRADICRGAGYRGPGSRRDGRRDRERNSAPAKAQAEMAGFDVFNGDADGLCALHQLRLAEPLESATGYRHQTRQSLAAPRRSKRRRRRHGVRHRAARQPRGAHRFVAAGCCGALLRPPCSRRRAEPRAVPGVHRHGAGGVHQRHCRSPAAGQTSRLGGGRRLRRQSGRNGNTARRDAGSLGAGNSRNGANWASA